VEVHLRKFPFNLRIPHVLLPAQSREREVLVAFVMLKAATNSREPSVLQERRSRRKSALSIHRQPVKGQGRHAIYQSKAMRLKFGPAWTGARDERR